MELSDLGLLAVRLAVGLTFAAHGAQKVFGWWGGQGFAGWTASATRIGLRPPALWAGIAAGVEVVGGLLLALGFLTPLAAALLLAQAIYIVVKAHLPRGFWSTKGGIEFPLQLLAGAVLALTAGPGALALDSVLGLDLPAGWRIAFFVGAMAGVGLAFALTRPAAPEAAQSKTA